MPVWGIQLCRFRNILALIMKNSDPVKLACFVISLNPDAPNFARLMNSLQAQGIQAGHFPAVDGRCACPALEGKERISERMSMLRSRRLLTPTEVGCYLSHLRAVKKAYDRGFDYVCVLEEDVVIEPEFGHTIRALSSENLDIVRLMAKKLRRRKPLRDIIYGVMLTRPERGTQGSQAYMMSRTGMKKFIDHASLIYRPIDQVLDHFFLFDLDTYGIEPHVAFELDKGSIVVKKHETPTRTPNLFERMAYHLVKLYFSLRRHWYLLRHQEDIYPATWPLSPPDKSGRLEGKDEAHRLFG